MSVLNDLGITATFGKDRTKIAAFIPVILAVVFVIVVGQVTSIFKRKKR